MKKFSVPFILGFFALFQMGSVPADDLHSPLDFTFQHELSRPLREISGVYKDGNNLWAIVDGPGSKLYRIDTAGNILQEISLANVTTTDVESVTADELYIYMGDTGNNHGNRNTLSIYKIKKSQVNKEPKTSVAVEVINYKYPEADAGKRKKNNNYDAESLISLKDSLYIFTKRRGDHQTELVTIPKVVGNYIARPIDIFNVAGLVTDAAINREGNEIALLGYEDGHHQPFIWLFSNFHGSHFFSGSHKEYQLSGTQIDWQTEGLCYLTDRMLVLSCEETRDQKASLYGLKRERLGK